MIPNRSKAIGWAPRTGAQLSAALVARVRAAARAIGIDFKRYVPEDPQSARLVRIFTALLEVRQISISDGEDEHCRFLEFCRERLGSSKAQLLQDLFVQYTLQEKRNGFFVEFGAGNGIDLSNTYLLETEYAWSGIVADPARCWRDSIAANRKCQTDFRCVWEESGREVEFNEVGEASTIHQFSNQGAYAETRRNKILYQVPTVSLLDLLDQHNAPSKIDYLSIDTEGSEFLILNGFDFEKYDIKVVTVEHNYLMPDRAKLNALLRSKGYKRKFEVFSMWDDWYVRG